MSTGIGVQPAIFISYRREDAVAHARLLHEALAARFGHGAVFRDVTTMAPGVDFPETIANALAACRALVALIGPRWLAARKDGALRLEEPDDYVRLEVSTALARGALVVPVLLEDTPMPARRQLPDVLAELADRHAVRLTDASWTDGVTKLVGTLEAAVVPVQPPDPPHGSRSISVVIGGSVGTGAMVAVGDGNTQMSMSAPSPELAEAISALRTRLRSTLSSDDAGPALQQLDDLAHEVTRAVPDWNKATSLRHWLAEHLPPLDGAVAGVTDHPTLRALLDGS